MRFRRTPPPEEPRGPSPATAPRPLDPWSPGGPLVVTVRLPSRTAPTPGEVVPTSEDEQRADDQALLRALVAHLASAVEAYDVAVDPATDSDDEREVADDETDERARAEKELEAFAGMLGRLAWGPRVLSPKERAWAVGAAERLDVSWGDPGARNRAVPRGKEVALLVDAMPRPTAPPRRKV